MAQEPLVLVSGFGPFEAVELNPSGAIARDLARRPPRGVRIRSMVLPVSFSRAPEAWDAFLARSGAPALCLGLGVAKRRGFRLERWGKPALKLIDRPDVDGRLPAEFSRAGPRLEAPVDLERLLAALRRRGVAEVRISHTAGGYVCERVYHHLLGRAAERGARGLFVHVPPLRFTPLARQIVVVRCVIEELFSLPDGRTGALKRRARSAGSRRGR